VLAVVEKIDRRPWRGAVMPATQHWEWRSWGGTCRRHARLTSSVSTHALFCRHPTLSLAGKLSPQLTADTPCITWSAAAAAAPAAAESIRIGGRLAQLQSRLPAAARTRAHVASCSFALQQFALHRWRQYYGLFPLKTRWHAAPMDNTIRGYCGTHRMQRYFHHSHISHPVFFSTLPTRSYQSPAFSIHSIYRTASLASPDFEGLEETREARRTDARSLKVPLWR